MIGVIAHAAEHAVVREFFELFKTPWEFYHPNRRYAVLICAGNEPPVEALAELIIIYSGHEVPSDAPYGPVMLPEVCYGRWLSHNAFRIPIYEKSVTFFRAEFARLVELKSQRSAAYLSRSSEGIFVRIGYDLFREIRILLTVGQPVCNAHVPTLDLHIALLREIIVMSGIALVEIPPVPEGYQFIACLTHDVDHPSIRQHRFDHTMFGFLYRATFGSLFGVTRRRVPLSHLLKNLTAVLKLPFIYFGVARDFWREFGQYLKLEQGLHSTFFVIPFKGDPGRCRSHGPAPRRRASGYAVKDIGEQILAMKSVHCEIGLHGIDAWFDLSKARAELEQVRLVTGSQELGVRMHWLYFDQDSPAVLDQAGADYDSTVGYNETVGYRAGTAQVFKPLQAGRLLELPLTIMDTALFFPKHLNLSPREAKEQVASIIDNAAQFGGCVTVNWHDRSIAPERLWGDFYVQLIEELKVRGAWFATASQSVAWFRKRRAAAFHDVNWKPSRVRVRSVGSPCDDAPNLQLRVHHVGGFQENH